MNPTQEQFLQAAGSAVVLLQDAAVAAAWDRPSALARYGVSGVAGHLARQILIVPRLLAQPVPDGTAVLPLLEHYATVAWMGDIDVDSDEHVRTRAGGEEEASAGPVALANAAEAATAALATALPAEPPGRLVYVPWGPWALSLSDLLVTRTMELLVHSDDLAVSVGVPTPELPAAVTDEVLGLLVRLAARRHGPTAVLRALSRAERAPATIAAF